MSGIYIHIPFCERACHYCNFHFSTSLKSKKELLLAMSKELVLQQNYLDTPLKTIYFGGGTPSLLEIEELEELLDTIRNYYETKHVSEITLEANPNDLSEKKLAGYCKLGINRLSIGIQSFLDRDLTALNRSHSSSQAINSITLAQNIGIHNISVDLIYGIPQMSDVEWLANIEQIITRNIPHISCYCLTIEDKTALADMIRKKKYPNTTENQGARQFKLLMQQMTKHNYHHYEISNFCKDELFSQHNTSYWRGISYLGIGPSAHSFNGKSRQWNIANNKKYIDSIHNNVLPYEQEVLTIEEKINEYIMTSLRTMWGCDLNFLTTNFSPEVRQKTDQKAQKYIQNKMMIYKNNHLILTKKGKLIADYITMDLFC